MAIDPEDEEWRIMQEYYRAIAERMIEAGWCTRAIDTNKDVSFGLTAKGVERMNNLFDALKELDPHTMRQEHVLGLFYFLVLRDEEHNPPESPN
jgi:hypothetical protein